MSNWKDTVMSAGGLCILVCQEYRSSTLEAKNCDGLDCEICQLNKQAEISLKTGMKEVVDWIERNKKIKLPKYQLKEWGIDENKAKEASC